jgi:hypothetical protein
VVVQKFPTVLSFQKQKASSCCFSLREYLKKVSLNTLQNVKILPERKKTIIGTKLSVSLWDKKIEQQRKKIKHEILQSRLL